MTSTTGRRSSCGFTLLELVLVMLIVTLLAGLAAPSLHNFIIGRNNANAVTQVLAVGQYARTRAAGTGVVYRLNLDPLTHVYWLTKLKGTAYVELGEEFGRHFALPDKMTAQWVPQQSGNQNCIDFYPDGRVDAATLRLVDSSGKMTELGCRSESEPLSILVQDQK